MTVTLAFDPTNADDRAYVGELLGSEFVEELGAIKVVEVEEAETSEEEFTVEDFLTQVGGGYEFIRLAVVHFGPDEEFGFSELAAASGEAEDDLKAYHRNLGRTARWLSGKAGDLERMIPKRWADGRNLYRIPLELHVAVTEREA
jgi:hypothetical protein